MRRNRFGVGQEAEDYGQQQDSAPHPEDAGYQRRDQRGRQKCRVNDHVDGMMAANMRRALLSIGYV